MACQAQQGLPGGTGAEFSFLCTCPVGGEKGCFHVCAQNACAVRLRRIHHAADGGNDLPGGGFVCRHGGWQKSRYALLIEQTSHRANGGFPLHHIMAAEGVNVRVHKAGQHKIPVQVSHRLIRQR